VTWENKQFSWKLSNPTSSELQYKVEQLQKNYDFDDGYESEISLDLPTFIQTLTDALNKGVILVSDYGYGQQEYYRPERSMGTLTCFYQHTHHDNPLIQPGFQDITAHVDFTSVIEAAASHGCALAGYTTQAAFLLDCGLMNLVEEQEKNLSPADKVNMHHAVKVLTMPAEMGERIKVMALAKNIELQLRGFHLQDRRREL
jgi:SAM-dependent MidA family methyltransferase